MTAELEQLRRGSVCLARDPSATDPSPVLVLLLQDARRAGRESVMVARLHAVTEETRSRAVFYGRLAVGRHPAALMVPQRQVKGAVGELYVSLLTIVAIPKESILERRGALSEEEMREVSERLVKTLELDVSRLIRPGHAFSRDPGRAQLPWWSQRGESDPRPEALETRQSVHEPEPPPAGLPRPTAPSGQRARRRGRP